MCTNKEANGDAKEHLMAEAARASEGIPEHALALDKAREASISCDGLQLASHYDRQALALFQLRNVCPGEDAWIYGLGIGDAVRLAATRAKGGTLVHAVILCPRLFCQLCQTDAFDGLFSNPKVRFELAGDARPEKNRAVCFPELMLEPGYANGLKSALRCWLDEDYARASFNRGPKERLAAAAKGNLAALLEERPYSPSDLPHCESAAVLCSGPSLKEDFPRLKAWLEEHPGAFTVAAETALIYLEGTDLAPSCIVSIDDLAGWRAGDLYMKDKERYKGSLLVFAASSPKKLWGDFPGRRRYLASSAAASRLPRLAPSAPLYSSGSVALACASLALATGASEIALAGADFAYDGAFSHAGIPIAGDPLTGTVGRIPVLCNDGEIRPTQRNFLAYREDLEALIASRPAVRFENLSSHGAVIRGAAKA